MTARTSVLLVLAVVAAAEKAKETKEPPKIAQVHPTDIIYATGRLMSDLHSAAYDAAEHHVTKHGLHTKAKEHYKNLVGDDVIGSTCKKVGCDAKDIQAKFDQVHATVQQGKAQAYDLTTQASNHLNGLAETIVVKFETAVPQYKGSIRKTFLDLLVVTLYFAFVVYMSVRCALFGVKKTFSIFCCVCCCGMCLRRKSAAKTGKKKGAAADAKATPKQAPAKAKAAGKK